VQTHRSFLLPLVGLAGLVAALGTLVTVGFEEIQAALGENDGSVVRAERTPANQPLILQMSDAPTSVADIVAQFVEAALRHNPKRADRPEHATLSAVDLVDVLPLAYGSPLPSARQVEILREHVTWIAFFVPIPIAAPAATA
jgi:hypothetical protein